MQSNVYNDFINDFSSVMCDLADGRNYSNILFVCIGTDRITGDSFGPLVGQKLKELFINANRINVIGDLSNPVSVSNATQIANGIREQYSNPLIIAVDSALSNSNNVGSIVVRKGGVDIGKGLNKTCIHIGDMSVQGIVAQNLRNSMQNFRMLQNTPLGLVMNMADVVSDGIYNIINYDCNE